MILWFHSLLAQLQVELIIFIIDSLALIFNNLLHIKGKNKYEK